MMWLGQFRSRPREPQKRDLRDKLMLGRLDMSSVGAL